MNFDFSQVVGATAKVEEVKEEVKVVQEVKEIKEVKEAPRTVAEIKTKKATVTEIDQAKEKVSKAKVEKAKGEVVSISNKNVVALSKEMAEIKKSLNDRFIERETEINILSVAFVSGTNVFLHGKPGTGKSDLVEEFSKRFVGSEYFRLLMSKTTEPSEVFGPVSINALKNDSYKVVTDNRLPKANIAFVDEVFKANSAVLNGLLTIMNEKLFFNDVVEEVPLVSMVGASNEFPEEESLAALYDRFLLRCNVEAIKDANNRVKLFKSFIDRRNSSAIGGQATTSSEPVMNYADLQHMMELAKTVTFDEVTIQEYNKLFVALEKEGIEISDRRKNEALKVIQATAVINGRLNADIEDFELLTYCFWEEIDDISIVEKIIGKLANPDADFIKGYQDSLNEMVADLDQFIEKHKEDDDFAISKAVTITELRSKVSFAIDKIDEKLDTVTNPANVDRYKLLTQDFKTFLDKITNMLVN